MRDFVNHQFPSHISFGIEFGPEFKTDIVTTSSGREYRNSIIAENRKRYYLSAILQSKEEAKEISDFFELVKGRKKSFRFKDLIENKLDKEQIAVADGTTRIFPIICSASYKQQKYKTRRIYAPRADSVVVYINNRVKKDFEILPDGQIKFKTLPANKSVIRVSCEYDIIVRFDNDYLPIIYEQSDLFRIEGLKLVEVVTQ